MIILAPPADVGVTRPTVTVPVYLFLLLFVFSLWYASVYSSGEREQLHHIHTDNRQERDKNS